MNVGIERGLKNEPPIRMKRIKCTSIYIYVKLWEVEEVEY